MIRIALTTFADEASATVCVRQLVEEKYVACGTLLPRAKSFFFWEGKTQEEQEIPVLFKVLASSYPAFAQRLLELHPYETPELLAWDCDAASPAYAEWVEKVCRTD